MAHPLGFEHLRQFISDLFILFVQNDQAIICSDIGIIFIPLNHIDCRTGQIIAPVDVEILSMGEIAHSRFRGRRPQVPFIILYHIGYRR